MTPEQASELKAHVEAIAAILYTEADPEQLSTLAGIEKTVRDLVLDHVTPQMGIFLSAQQQGQSQEELDTSKASLGNYL